MVHHYSKIFNLSILVIWSHKSMTLLNKFTQLKVELEMSLLININKEALKNPTESQDTFKVPELSEIEIPVDERIVSISSIINLVSRGGMYSIASSSWVLLENIVKYTWKIITFELISPLELSRTDAYKDISLLTECVLNLHSHAKLSNSIYRNLKKQNK